MEDLLRFEFLALLALPVAALAADLNVRGIVTFNAKPVASAHVTIRTASRASEVRTDDAGMFSTLVPAAREFDVIVAPVCVEGTCAPRTQRHFVSSDVPLRLDVGEPVVSEKIVVTAARAPTRLDDSAQSIVVVSADDIRHSAGRTTDEVLRQVPGFSLFRRSSSAASNPTSQGASLRGIGGSGASRALVLLDGIPLNDPFGGWIQWGRAPRFGLDRIEVLRGGGSDLYGSSAFGGVINMLTTGPSAGLRVEASAGTLGSADVSFSAATASEAGGATLSAGSMNYDGYEAVPDVERGYADRRVSSSNRVVEGLLTRRLGSDAIAFLRGSWFAENRGNGTALQTNDTSSRQASAGATLTAKGITFDARAYASDQTYHQTFSSLSPDHDTEQLTRLQTVPSSSIGFSGQVSRAFDRQMVVGGVELRQVNGWSDESTPAGFASRAGGRQRSGGVFLEDVLQLSTSWSVRVAARYDAWENFDASHRTPAGETPFADRSDGAFSPRLAVSWRAADRLTLNGSVYRAFRAPTLNELYRSFRLGNVVTLANESLAPERLAGAEAGALFRMRRDVSARVNLYQMDVSDAVFNVTRTSTPSLITRQRANVGRTRSRGVEADLDSKLGHGFSLTAGYLYVQPVVTSFAADPTLRGRDLPQVPRQQATMQLRQTGAWGTASLQARWTAAQFDDDRNALRLASYASVDAYVERSMSRNVEAFAAVENIFDKRAEIGRTPGLTLGPPRSLTVGIRYR